MPLSIAVVAILEITSLCLPSIHTHRYTRKVFAHGQSRTGGGRHYMLQIVVL